MEITYDQLEDARRAIRELRAEISGLLGSRTGMDRGDHLRSLLHVADNGLGALDQVRRTG